MARGFLALGISRKILLSLKQVCPHDLGATKTQSCRKDAHTLKQNVTEIYVNCGSRNANRNYHLLTTYRPSTDHLPITYRPLTDHLPTTYRSLTDYIRTTCRPLTDHLPTAFFTVQLVQYYQSVPLPKFEIISLAFKWLFWCLFRAV